MEVVIDGRRYVPAEPEADRLSFRYIHANHTFSKLLGVTLEEILSEADEIERDSPWGMLCPVIVLRGDKELRRVGPGVHSHGKGKERESWEAGKKAWREVVEKDADIIRLLPLNGAFSGAPTGASAGKHSYTDNGGDND